IKNSNPTLLTVTDGRFVRQCALLHFAFCILNYTRNPMADPTVLSNFINGRWAPASATDFVEVHNPARGVVIAKTPLSTAGDVDAAVRAASAAFPGWSETPPVVRARSMFTFKQLLEEHFEELARLVTTEHGKRVDECS